MKNCPNCNAEIEDNYELCWNCNYSFTEKKVIKIKDLELESPKKEINCLRCNEPCVYSGEHKFHEGFPTGVFGDFFELFVNKKVFDIYMCPKCGKVEFFVPMKGEKK